MNTRKVEKVFSKDNYINQMWNDIKTKFGNDRHSYLIIRNYDIYDDTIFNRTEKGVCFWREIKLWVDNDVDFTELLQRIGPDVLNIGLCNKLPQLRQVPTYCRVTYEKDKYYIYQIKNSSELKKLVTDRYCLSYDQKTQTEYGNKLAKFFGEIVEEITINK
jgi:hypothetical protein